MTDHDYIDPADVKVGQRVQVEAHDGSLLGYIQEEITRSPIGTVDIVRGVDIVHGGQFRVAYPGDATAWYVKADRRLRVRLIEDTKPDLAPGIYNVAVGDAPLWRVWVKWDGRGWRTAGGTALSNDFDYYTDPRPVLLDSQIAVDRPNTTWHHVRALAADLNVRAMTGSAAIVSSVADALEREEGTR